MPVKHVFSVPVATPEVVAMLTSGLTASISLEQVISCRSEIPFNSLLFLSIFPMNSHLWWR